MEIQKKKEKEKERKTTHHPSSLSLSSSASCTPVEAPEGTAARNIPFSVIRSTCNHHRDYNI